MSAGMLCLYDLETPMRDGVLLRGDLYRPAGDGRWPVLLLRTVFRKRDMGRSFQQYDPSYYVRRGYAVFIQDVRGLGESDGEFDRFTADGPDGYDTVEWLAAQPWCTGDVGMVGSYYAGYLQLMAALEAPPHLRAICPMQTSVSINRDCDNRGFLFASHVGWCMSRLVNRLRDGRYDEATTSEMLPKLLKWLGDYPLSQLSVMPLERMPALRDTPFQLLRDYRRHLLEGFDDFDLLHKEGRDADLTGVRTPAFYVCGWYDSSRTPLIDHCMTQRRAGVDSRVLVAPWKPGEPPARPDSALENGVYAVDLQAEIVAWFDHWLKGGPAPKFPPVRCFDISGGAPFEGDRWPEAPKAARFYLTEGGALSEAAGAPGTASFSHDPRNPLPYRGYGRSAPFSDGDGRALLFTSAPLQADLPVCGLVRATVTVSATARDADIMLCLMDVAPDGTCFRVCDGATRASYARGWTREPLSPGEKREIEVLLGHVRYTLGRGHRLAAEFCGSAFPKYDVNHGTCARPAADGEAVASRTTLHFGGAARAFIDLPVL
ncbi:MAG: CocE/NonD family hydrolase [Clostridia bacterium]|nr:CocE/NonD family hydrolase [Clostridia bacterium]